MRIFNAQDGAIGAGVGEQAQTDQTKQQTPQAEVSEMTNAEAKKLPWVKDLAAELAALKKEKADREAAEARKQLDAELEKAKAEQRYEDALRIQRQELEAAKQKALHAELKASLLANGARISEGFLKVAAAEFDPSKFDSVDSFTESLKNNDAYSIFFQHQQSRTPLSPPNPTPVNNSSTVNWDEVKAWEKSGDPKLQREAAKRLREYREQHGKYPYSL